MKLKKRRKRSVFYMAITIALVSICSSCSKDKDDSPTNIAYTDARTFIASINYEGAVLIRKNGQDILRDGFGKANKEANIINTVDTKFRLASVSKTFVGMGMIQLQRDGFIQSFEQTISDFDPNFPSGDKISLRQLLTHTSGLPDYLAAFEELAIGGQFFSGDDIYDAIAETVAEDGFVFTPGSKIQYANTNFLICALLIEELSGMTYYEYIQKNVLNPLEMNDTEAGQIQIPQEGYAQGYHKDENVSEYPIYIALGAGDYTSTVSDMEKWCTAVMGDQWFSTTEKELIFGGDIPLDGTTFGLAWFQSNIEGKDFFWHGGDIDGFSTLIGFVPSSQSILIALSNEQDDLAVKRNKIIENIIKEEF